MRTVITWRYSNAALIALILILALVVAVWIQSNLNTQNGEDILSDPSCIPPCWSGIVPGVTSSSRAIEILKARRSARNISRESKPNTPFKDVILIYWNEMNHFGDNYLVTSKGVVTEVQIHNYTQLTLGKVIDVLGPPEFNIAYIFNAGESTVIRFVGYYHSKGVVIVITTSYKPELNLTPDLRVNILYFFEPMTAEGMLNLYPFMELYHDAQYTRKNWQPWIGFDKILIPPNPPCPP